MPVANQDTLPSTNGISLEGLKALSQASFKTLAQVAQFNPATYVKHPIFSTESLQFGIYCFESGQVNALHKHPQSDEICYFIQGTGEVLVQDEVTVVQPGVFVHFPKAVLHEIRNTGPEPMLVIVVQSPPLPPKR